MGSNTLARIADALGWFLTRVGDLGRTNADVIGTRRFPRRLQWDSFSCGSRSTWAIAHHFGRELSHDEVMDGVGTTTEGTAATPIVKFLRTQGLRAGYHRRMSNRQLVRALDRGGVVLVDLNGTHWSVVHAVSAAHVWLANPSTSQLGRRVPKATFRSQWTGLGVVVTERPADHRAKTPRGRR